MSGNRFRIAALSCGRRRDPSAKIRPENPLCPAWIIHNADTFGYHPSAGGHLAALLASDPRWLEQQGVEPDLLAGAIASSGVFDVAPLIQPSRRWQRVFPAGRRKRPPPSPTSTPPTRPLALLVEENGAFMRSQTRAIADALRDVGRESEIIEVPGVNHITTRQG